MVAIRTATVKERPIYISFSFQPLAYRRYAARLLWAPLAKRLYGSHPYGRGTVGPKHYRRHFLRSYYEPLLVSLSNQWEMPSSI